MYNKKFNKINVQKALKIFKKNFKNTTVEKGWVGFIKHLKEKGEYPTHLW